MKIDQYKLSDNYKVPSGLNISVEEEVEELREQMDNTHFVLLLDDSGSMSAKDGPTYSYWQKAKGT